MAGNSVGRVGRAVVLLAATVATGCASSDGRHAAGIGADAPPCPLACRLASYGKYQDAAWGHLASLGVHYVFMDVPPPDRVDVVRKRLADHDLAALVLRGQADFTRPSPEEELAGQLAVAQRMGVRYMFLSVKGKWPDKGVVYERLRRCGDVAARHGVTLALETHPELGTNGDVQLATMRGVNHPNVRVNFDTGNITFYNTGTDAVRELKKIVDYVVTVELKDHDGRRESWNFPALGKGVVDFPGVLKILRSHGYSGPLTMELEGTQGVERDEQQTKDYIAQSVAYVRSLGTFR